MKTGSIELREESEALVTQLTASANRTFFAYLMLPLASVTTDLYVRSWPFSAHGSQFWGRTDTNQVDALTLSNSGTTIAYVDGAHLELW